MYHITTDRINLQYVLLGYFLIDLQVTQHVFLHESFTDTPPLGSVFRIFQNIRMLPESHPISIDIAINK